jgi:hypothetical protein
MMILFSLFYLTMRNERGRVILSAAKKLWLIIPQRWLPRFFAALRMTCLELLPEILSAAKNDMGEMVFLCQSSTGREGASRILFEFI